MPNNNITLLQALAANNDVALLIVISILSASATSVLCAIIKDLKEDTTFALKNFLFTKPNEVADN